MVRKLTHIPIHSTAADVIVIVIIMNIAMRVTVIMEIYRICIVMADIQMPEWIHGTVADAAIVVQMGNIVIMRPVHLPIMVNFTHTVTITR